MDVSYQAFLNAFPQAERVSADAGTMASFADEALGVAFPEELAAFLQQAGGGYFGRNDLYFFADGEAPAPRDSFQEWNRKDFWADIFPRPADGGPVFFAETCFGDQLGYRRDGDRFIFILFAIDTFESFVIALSAKELFEQVLTERFALVDPQRLLALENRYGVLLRGMHYAPLASPLLGGSGAADNFCQETPNVHFRTALATLHTLRQASES
ncbi:SMI1/KNR4 family protein [Janthinobacterium lividum]|nr:SMI1/KNR4 family protein [Janthinobacterium lividum]